ncbi:MAG: FMN-binding negative transcriptional regulator, partial [Burkholderiales bacterium]
MHIPPLFAEERLEEIRRIIQSSPLATLVTDSRDRLEANLLPLEWFDASERGQLRGHVARNHPLFSNTRPGSDSLVVFQGPNAYISPRWYVNGQKSRRVAPSWNYVAVEVRGKIRFI